MARGLKVLTSQIGCPSVYVTGTCLIVNGRGVFYVFTAAELAEQLRWWFPVGADFRKIYDDFGDEYFVYKGR